MPKELTERGLRQTAFLRQTIARRRAKGLKTSRKQLVYWSRKYRERENIVLVKNVWEFTLSWEGGYECRRRWKRRDGGRMVKHSEKSWAHTQDDMEYEARLKYRLPEAPAGYTGLCDFYIVPDASGDDGYRRVQVEQKFSYSKEKARLLE